MKQFLTQKGFEYKEIDVSKDYDAAMEMVRITGQRGVPVTMIGDRPVVGFDQEQISELLGIH